jgi:hypothetical protein
MNHLTRSKRLGALGALTVAAAASTIVAHAAAGVPAASHASPLGALASGAGGPNGFATAQGLDPADATHVFTLADGVSVGVVGNGLSRCLIRGIAGRTAATCASTAAISEGHGISVADECGTSGSDRMEITGLAPAGAVSARLLSTDGTSRSTPVTDGAFRFDGTNPSEGAPYPIEVEWAAAGGAGTGDAALPVEGDQFCLPT